MGPQDLTHQAPVVWWQPRTGIDALLLQGRACGVSGVLAGGQLGAGGSLSWPDLSFFSADCPSILDTPLLGCTA